MKDKIKQLIEAINTSEAIIIGAGSGLSTSAGFTYSGKRFEQYFGDFIKKYHFQDMYSAGFYPFETLEEYWAYWSRYIYYNRYVSAPKNTYQKLFKVINNKDYFVITTNVDHQFQQAGFDKQRLFYTQGDYGLWQCSVPCHQQTYDNEKIVKEMVKKQQNLKIPTDLIPRCPICNKPMTMNLRCDQTFVQDKYWYQAKKRYQDFINKHHNSKILYLELGVGNNTPAIIKYPFWQMTYQNPNATYACINFNDAYAPKEIQKRSICINGDIDKVLECL
ncbi:Sir2 silent information regulator family NAD-dependent deacetylase [Thomasclavelia sp.]|uniref:SIR2 family NAD-dependent protein deacylase n=1 Tax=Thomasclavelia sp. TaxID=3025757 RepID=UPI0025F58A22|nr:Sir2 silent information regulator family NAD-dependent deacetylase [Thomasclavelia sp.]